MLSTWGNVLCEGLFGPKLLPSQRDCGKASDDAAPQGGSKATCASLKKSSRSQRSCTRLSLQSSLVSARGRYLTRRSIRSFHCGRRTCENNCDDEADVSAPLSSVPFDLLFLHLVVPPTVKRLKLDKRAKKLWLKYWIMSTEAFCLSGLLRFTVRDWKVKEETGPRALERLWPILHPIVRFCFGPYRLEATQARVPAADTVAVLPLAERRKGGVFIPLNEWGAPKTPEDKMRLLKQDRRARQLHRDPKYDYDVVWLPKYWQTRIYAYIFTTIAAVAIVISLCFFVPLILGRFVLDPFGKNPLHDGYNFVSHRSIVTCANSQIAGVYLCILWGWASGQVDKLVLRLTSADQIRRSKRSVRVKRSILKFVRKVSMLVLLFGVTPTVFGLVFELYIALPGKYGLDKTATPVLHLWDAW